jgi:hypothetical protein
MVDVDTEAQFWHGGLPISLRFFGPDPFGHAPFMSALQASFLNEFSEPAPETGARGGKRADKGADKGGEA